MAERVFLEAENAVFWPEINFLETSSKFFVAIMAGHQRDNFFVLTASHGGPRGGRQGPFLAHFFTLRPYNPHFLGSDGPDSMGS